MALTLTESNNYDPLYGEVLEVTPTSEFSNIPDTPIPESSFIRLGNKIIPRNVSNSRRRGSR